MLRLGARAFVEGGENGICWLVLVDGRSDPRRAAMVRGKAPVVVLESTGWSAYCRRW